MYKSEIDTTRLEAIESRLKRARPGHWEIPEGTLNGCAWSVGPIEGYDGDALGVSPDNQNLVFVSYAREDVAYLLKEVKRLAAILEKHPNE
jgi:hypothetical protein